MRVLQMILWLAAALGLAACAASGLTPGQPPVRVAALLGSSLAGVEISSSETTATVRFDRVPPTGQFVRLSLPPGQHAGEQRWEGAADAVQLVVPTAEGADIGIVPLPGKVVGPVTLRLELAAAPRSASVPPVGDYNVITDLTVSDAGAGGIRLEWTQINTGDYDFNGEVNLSDLVPIAMHFNDVYDRQASGAAATTEYWVDGDANGEVNVADVTPIGLNYNALVVGYNIRSNGALIPGPEPGGPTMPASQAQLRDNLPPRYSVVVTGLITDTFVVAPVDADGIEGADSSGNAGPVELLANLNIDGQLLLDILNGQNPGVFGPGKIGLRVIDPIEVNNSIELGSVTQTSAETAEIRGLPNDQTLYLQLQYIPAVDLITGNPKSAAGVRSASALEDAIVLTSIPLRIPSGTEPVQVIASVSLDAANPAGGFFTDLHTEITFPGDNPATPEVETSYTIITDKRVDNFGGLVAADTDNDPDDGYDDEAWLEDDDRDCASERLRENELDDDDDEFDERNELELEGIVSGFNEAAGSITLTGAVLEVGDLEVPLPDPLTLLFSELTQFEEKIKTDGDDIEQDLDPSTITNGDNLHVDLYRLADTGGVLPDKYWVEKVERVIDQTD